MSTHRYLRSALRGDCIRAAVGTGFCGLALVLAWGSPWPRWIFLALTAFFLLFAGRVFLRFLTEFELTETHLRRSIAPANLTSRGLSTTDGVSLAWNTLRHVRLRYYSTRRDRSDGWMTLTLRGQTPNGRAVRMGLDSTVEDFQGIARAVAKAAVAQGVELSSATLSNLAALDVRVEQDDPHAPSGG